MFTLLTASILALHVQPAGISLDDPLTKIEAYVNSIKSYDIQFKVTSTNYYKSDTSNEETKTPSKLIKRDKPSSKIEYVRQTFSGKNTSYQLFDDKKRLVSKVHNDGEIDRGIVPEAAQCFIRKTKPQSAGYGKDYRETHKLLRAGIPVIELLKRRANLHQVSDNPGDQHNFVSDPPVTRTAMSDFVITIRLLPDHSMAIGSMEFTPKQGVKVPIRYSVVNKKFLKLPDGVSVPIESLFSLYTPVDDSSVMTLIATIEVKLDVTASKWNCPVKESDYQVVFPKGSKVIDDIRKMVYVIEEEDTGKK